jgi:hypothetical protein
MVTATPAFAALGDSMTGPEPVISYPIEHQVMVSAPIPVAFSVVPNRYTDVDPATSFDLNGDLVGDMKVTSTTVTGQNGELVQLLEPAQFSLDDVQTVPAAGYAATAPLQLSRVYVLKLSGGGYAKFLLLQTTPKITIWFHFGMPTSSVLAANGASGHAVLTWGALTDAQQGYNIYRYEFLDSNSYTVTLLNDFAVQETTFTDNTAQNHYYLYVVVAIKSTGSGGASTTVVAVLIHAAQRSLVVSLTPGTAKLDGANISLSTKPVIKNGRLMIPASLLTNAGVKVTFEASTGRIALTRRLDNVTYTIVMTVDVPDYTWNGTAYKAAVPPYVAGSEAMVPLRVVGPALGYGLTFNSADRTATIQWSE